MWGWWWRGGGVGIDEDLSESVAVAIEHPNRTATEHVKPPPPNQETGGAELET